MTTDDFAASDRIDRSGFRPLRGVRLFPVDVKSFYHIDIIDEHGLFPITLEPVFRRM